VEGPTVKNITLSADAELIEAARKQALAERTTLNAQFRRWLADYARGEDRAARARSAWAQINAKPRHDGRKFTRDEMNER
jgi:hypothetical protein